MVMKTGSNVKNNPRGINQGPEMGPYEPYVIQKGGFNTPLGNGLAFDQAKTAGPGSNRDVMKSGYQGQRGSNPGNPPKRPRSGDVMS